MLTDRRYNLPALEWIQGIGRAGQPLPRRVLVAGCGSGAEAFGLRRRLPNAKIVAVDFSARSIAHARRLQRSVRSDRPVKFEVADLTKPGLAAQVGNDFELITCHGVLSYVPDPGRVLVNLTPCLQPGGALYLGVNGAGHPAVALREWLPQFGMEMDEMQDERRLRKLLAVWDALHEDAGVPLADSSEGYLAGDICGHHFNNWDLARWRGVVNAAGWEIVGTWLLPPTLRQTLKVKAHRPLFPDGVGELAAALDGARPASFHRMMLRRGVPGPAPWDVPAGRSAWDLRWSGLYTLRIQTGRAGAKAWAVLRSRTLDMELEWPLSLAQAGLARELARSGSAGAGWIGRWARSESARRTLALWAGFGIITLAQRQGEPLPLPTDTRGRKNRQPMSRSSPCRP